MKQEDIKSYLDNPQFIEAVILGELYKIDNKIQVGKFNKFAKEFNLDKQNKQGVEELLSFIHNDEDLVEIYNSATLGNIDTQTLKELNQQEANSAFNTISSYVIDNTEVLANNREFNKIQREGAYLHHLIDGLHRNLRDELDSLKVTNYIDKEFKVTFPNGNKEMVLCLADWHIGALVNNVETGGYDFNMFKERLNEVINQAIAKIKEKGIRKVHVYHIGDIIEHINMRNVNQAFEAEFPATEQIAKGIRVLVEALNTLADTGIAITFGLVGGNHDRFQGNKNDKIYNDNIGYLVLDNLFFVQELGGLRENVTLLDNRNDTYNLYDQVAGKKVKVVHGDHEGKKTDVKIPKHIKNEAIDYLIMGHIHTTRIIQEDYSRFHVYVGSTMGANNYSAENNLPTTSPSQMFFVIDPEQYSPEFQPVFL